MFNDDTGTYKATGTDSSASAVSNIQFLYSKPSQQNTVVEKLKALIDISILHKRDASTS